MLGRLIKGRITLFKKIIYAFLVCILVTIQAEDIYAMPKTDTQFLQSVLTESMSAMPSVAAGKAKGMFDAKQSTVQIFAELDQFSGIAMDSLDFLFELKERHPSLSISYLVDGMAISNRNATIKEGIKYDFVVFSYFRHYRFGRRAYSLVRYDEQYVLKRENLTKFTISAAGDCTLGTDEKYGYIGSFMHEFEVQNRDYSYFFGGVRDIFRRDDLTIVNLETPLTNATQSAEKEFAFKGLPEFTNILTEGNIEAVNLANNHTRDYLQQGYEDTMRYLSEANIAFFGEGITSIIEVKGIKVGLLGHAGWNDSAETRKKVKNNIDKLKEDGAQLILATFHWGTERANYPNAAQKNLARYAIDCGADLIIGHHPHVLQGIDEYKGKMIIYSLGNFSFGGNKNPSDKDTMIFQQTFTFANGLLHDDKEIKIIPCLVSSVKNRNDYRPTTAENEDFERIRNRIITYSAEYSSIETVKNGF